MTVYQNWWGGGDSISPFRHWIWHRSGWNTGLFSNVLAHGPLSQVTCSLSLCSANVLLWPPLSPQDWRVLSPVDHVARQFKGGKVWDYPHAWRHCPWDWQQYPGTQLRSYLPKLTMFQVRTSYLPTEILWGYKFEHSCVEYNPKLATYDVSFESLNTMIRDNTPWYKYQKC